MAADISVCKKKLSYLKGKRTSYELTWKEISSYLVPDRGFFDGEVAGQEKTCRGERI